MDWSQGIGIILQNQIRERNVRLPFLRPSIGT